MKRLLPLCLCAWAVLATVAGAAGDPQPTPRISLGAEFVENTRCPIFQAGQPVTVQVVVEGHRHGPETLEWTLTDYRDQLLKRGEEAVPKGEQRWEKRLSLPSDSAGYFQVNLRLAQSRVRIPATGSRPAGFLAYGVLPPIVPQPLEFVDQSRFGAQGTNFIKSGKQMVGDFVDPVYPALGAKWIYSNRRPAELYGKGPDSYRPRLDPELWRQRGMCEAAAGLCLLIDSHSVPSWLMDYPEGVKPKANPNPSFDLQAYPPKDFAAYREMMRQIATEQVVWRKTLFPRQKHSYYEIHWEPDWHWKGSDEQFVAMYRAASEGIHEGDPDGRLLGANFGVLKAGNERFRRLFALGLGKYLDGIVTHTYYIPIEQPPEAGDMLAELRDLVALKRQYLPAGTPLINSEWGLNYFGRPPDRDPTALRREAAWFLRGHLIALGEGCDTTFFFYTADIGVEGGGGLLYNLTTPNPMHGATHVAPKPVFMACAAATRLLEGSQSLGAIDYLGAEVWGYAFAVGGQNLLALWSKDDRTHSIGVPCGVERVTVFDPMGNARELACPGGVAQLEIGAMPVWLRGVAAGTLPFAAAGSAIALKAPAPCLPGQALAAVAPPAEAPLLKVFDGSQWLAVEPVLPPTLSAGAALLGAFAADRPLVPAAVAVLRVEPVVSLARGLADDPQRTLALAVANRTTRPLAGTLTVRSRHSEAVERPAAIAPGQTVTLTFAAKDLPFANAASSPLTVSFGEPAGSRVQAELAPGKLVLIASRSTGAIAADGDLREWQLERFVEYRGETKDGQPLAIRLALACDDQALYLALRVPDANHYQQWYPPDAWKGDSVQIGLAPEGKYAPGEWHKLLLGLPTAGGKAFAYCHEGPATLKGQFDAGTVPFAVRRGDGETVYELAYPWSRLGWERPPAQMRFGLLVNLVDLEDGQPSPRRLLDYFGGMAWGRPAEFPALRLQ